MRAGSSYRRIATRLTLLYVAAASVWPVSSDALVSRLGLPDATFVGAGKGLLFVAVTGGVLYAALRHWASRVEIGNSALAESESDYRQLFEANPNPMWVYDLETQRFLAVNAAAIASYGYLRDEFLTMTIADIRPASDIGTLLDSISEVEEGHHEAGVQLHITKDGRQLSVETVSHVVEFEGRRAEVVLAMTSVITERTGADAELAEYRARLEDIVRERTEELQRANTRLEHLTNFKSDFLANMSHELRTPLNSIIGFSGIMIQGLAGDLTEEQRKQMGMIYKSGTHLLDLINDILDISKIEAGRVEVEPQPFDMSSLVDSVIESVRPRAAQKSLALQVRKPAESLTAHTDRMKVRQILMNLIGNALKFTEEGSVTVALEHDGETARISVSDTGPGIPAEEFSAVFDEFRQARHRTDKKPPGTGLGLAISLRLARLLHGDIHMQSELDKGSIFTLEIPLTWPGFPAGEDVSGAAGHAATAQRSDSREMSDVCGAEEASG
ncbi:MAG: ATP-binding protein [Coriobacteriia bacterium]|nr:ATP-binding protein [Coriobacteriia bacterium]